MFYSLTYILFLYIFDASVYIMSQCIVCEDWFHHTCVARRTQVCTPLSYHLFPSSPSSLPLCISSLPLSLPLSNQLHLDTRSIIVQRIPVSPVRSQTPPLPPLPPNPTKWPIYKYDRHTDKCHVINNDKPTHNCYAKYDRPIYNCHVINHRQIYDRYKYNFNYKCR